MARRESARAVPGWQGGRFRVMVDAPNGEPDEEFIETFTSPLMGGKMAEDPEEGRRCRARNQSLLLLLRKRQAGRRG